MKENFKKYIEDGVDHINIYSKGKTPLGRWLSNWEWCPIEIDGTVFITVEGYWYYLLTGQISFSKCNGYTAKIEGRKVLKNMEPLMDKNSEEFKNKIRKAIDLKMKTRTGILFQDFIDSTLPFTHYYVYGSKRVYAGYEWITEHITHRRKQLKERYYAGTNQKNNQRYIGKEDIDPYQDDIDLWGSEEQRKEDFDTYGIFQKDNREYGPGNPPL